MNISSRLSLIARRPDTLIFVGAGVSMWSGLPSWRSLVQRLEQFILDLGHDESAALVRREIENSDLLLAASYGFDVLNEHEQHAFIKSVIPTPLRPSPLHEQILKLPSRSFATTNYDKLIEKSILEADASADLSTVTRSDRIEMANISQVQSTNFVFKPHGDIDSFDTVVLTREHYKNFRENHHAAYNTLRTLLISRPTLYIGYGLRDPDFLLLQESIPSFTGALPIDHYAIMPDVPPAERAYWARNYGIAIHSYDTFDPVSGRHTHDKLLEIVANLASRTDESVSTTRSEGYQQTANGSGDAFEEEDLLALARYARRALNEYPATTNPIPLNATANDLDSPRARYRVTSEPARYIVNSVSNIIVSGSPGAGKSHTLEQAFRTMAATLEEDVLQSTSDSSAHTAPVPVFASLSGYQGSIAKLVDAQLPADLPLARISNYRQVAIFLDGANETPSEYANELQADVSDLLAGTTNIRIAIATRFPDEIPIGGAQSIHIDSISPSFVEDRIKEAHICLEPEVFDLMTRPLFFMWWMNNLIDLRQVDNVHDVYTQILDVYKRRAKSTGATLDRGSALEAVAFNMIDSGTLYIPIEEALATISGSQQVEQETKILDDLVEIGILVASPGRRVGFVHHTVAEYLAARQLAQLVTADESAVDERLRRTSWNQTLLLSLGYLDASLAKSVFARILDADIQLASTSIRYIEHDQDLWLKMTLERIATQLREILSRVPGSDEFAAERYQQSILNLPTNPEHTEMLLRIADMGNGVGGTALAKVWVMSSGEDQERLRISYLEGSEDFNFLARFAEEVARSSTDSRAVELLAESIMKTEIGCRDDDSLAGPITLASTLAEALPTQSRRVLRDRYQNTPFGQRATVEFKLSPAEDIDFLCRSAEGGNEFAIFPLHMLLRFKASSKPIGLTADASERVAMACWTHRKSEQRRWVVETIYDLQAYSKRSASQFLKVSDDLDNAVLALLDGEVDRAITLFENAIAKDERVGRVAGELIDSSCVDWDIHGQKLIRIALANRDEFAIGIVEASYNVTVDDGPLLPEIDLDAWLGWVVDSMVDPIGNWMLIDRLRDLIANNSSDRDIATLIAHFNSATRYSRECLEPILARVPHLDLTEFSWEAIDWLAADLETTRRRGFDMYRAMLVVHANEEMVDKILVPRYAAHATDGVASALRMIGRRLGRRYVNESGELFG